MSAPRLLDANLLLALTVENHIHHQPARAWFARSKAPFATCPITQGSLLRLRLSLGASASFADALAVLQAVVATFDRGLAALHGTGVEWVAADQGHDG